VEIVLRKNSRVSTSVRAREREREEMCKLKAKNHDLTKEVLDRWRERKREGDENTETRLKSKNLKRKGIFLVTVIKVGFIRILAFLERE
jgi:hypothetical protein